MSDPDIKDITEARKWLNLLVEQGEALSKLKVTVPNKGSGFGIIGENGMKFDIASRLLIPAMVKGVKAVMEQYVVETDLFQDPPKVFTGSEWKDSIKARKLGSSFQVLALANAYHPAMVELGWVPE